MEYLVLSNNHPLVSILINNYNYGRFLAEAIDSALNQTYPHIEIIVVDDGSTDNSREIIKSYENKIIPILKHNGGQASAFNAGFAASQGEIICFLDSDDIFQQDKVKEVVDIFTNNQGIGWCFHSLKFLSEESEKFVQQEPTGLSGKYDIRSDIQRGKLKNKLPLSGTATSGTCFHRTLLERILPMPEEINITSDDYLKYTALGLSPGFILLKNLSLQRIHDSNAYTLRPDKAGLRSKIQILTAYWMKKNFPVLSKFTNNTLALGMGMYWRYVDGGIEAESKKLIKRYLSSVTPLDRLELYARAFYYRVKL
jgi:glycosyltransferase involved in cell wall biosynthesis